MKKLATLLCALCLLAGMHRPGQAFQEYPSLEIVPYVGYFLYDSQIKSFQSNLSYGLRLELRTMPQLGFQFHYSRSTMSSDFPSQPFSADRYVERVQLNLTRDLFLIRGVFLGGYGGIGSFNRRTPEIYNTDFSLQAGLSARRNLFDFLYLRADGGWTGAFLKDHDPDALFGKRSMTQNFEVSLTLSVLLDN